MSRVTQKQFRLFEKEVRKWCNSFGFSDWNINIFMVKLEDGTLAECEWNINYCQAIIRMNGTRQDGDAPLTNDRIKRLALHECAELLLCVCTETMRESRSWEFVNRETHRVIRVLENVLCGSAK